MTNARSQIGELLAARLPNVQDHAERLISARRWAVHYEQVAAEYIRRVRIASLLISDEPCDCSTDRQCLPCRLAAVLEGDE